MSARRLRPLAARLVVPALGALALACVAGPDPGGPQPGGTEPPGIGPPGIGPTGSGPTGSGPGEPAAARASGERAAGERPSADGSANREPLPEGAARGDSTAGPGPALSPGARLRVMPLGDSITIGYGSIAGYRLPLWLFARAYGREALDLVGGRVLNSPPQFPDREHEGHSGWRLRDFAGFAGDADEPPSSIEELLDAARPDVVLLHAGTNDLWSPSDWFEAPEDLGHLLDRIHAHAPGVRVVVALLLPTVEPAANLGVRWLNERFARVVHERWTDGRPLGLVDMQAACPVLTTNDGVHPDLACYEAMACAWLDALLDPGALVALPPDPAPPVPVRASRVEGVGSLAPLAQALGGPGRGGPGRGGPGLADGLAEAERDAPLGWRSEPVELVAGPEGASRVAGDPPCLVLELEGAHDLESVELWNGRVTEQDGVWTVREALREVRAATSADGRTWTERGVWELLEPLPGARRPGERRGVDWPGVRWVRFELCSTHARLGEAPAARRCLALSGLTLRGRPSAGRALGESAPEAAAERPGIDR